MGDCTTNLEQTGPASSLLCRVHPFRSPSPPGCPTPTWARILIDGQRGRGVLHKDVGHTHLKRLQLWKLQGEG